jgi:hypothetical protein
LPERVFMSCRIDRLVGEGGAVIMRISGRLAAHDVDILRSLLDQEPGTVALDLRDLLFVDRSAVMVLALAEASGSAELRNCPPYVRECVAQARREERHDVDM